MIWKLDPECLWSDQHSASDYIINAGVKAVFCVADNCDICPTQYPLPFFRFPYADNVRLSEGQIGVPLKMMLTATGMGVTPIVVLCRAGLSRSVAFAALWFSYRRGIEFQEAVRRIREIRPGAFPHQLMIDQMDEYRRTH